MKLAIRIYISYRLPVLTRDIHNLKLKVYLQQHRMLKQGKLNTMMIRYPNRLWYLLLKSQD
jgi:hypothetical protein